MIKKIIRKNTVNRDISWMYFNRRILDEAANPDIPLLERLSYLGIYSNNLDEFFQVRVASIRRKVEFEKKVLNTQPDSKKNLKAILKLNEKNTTYFECIFSDLNQELSKENIFLINETQLSDEQAAFVTDFYTEELPSFLISSLYAEVSHCST